MDDKIKELLGIGLQQAVVASAVGCSESYVSQLMSEDAFRAEVTNLRLINLTEAADRDGTYNSLEDRLLEKLENLLPVLVNPMQVLAAIRTINGAHRRAAPAELAANAQQNIVQLQLPENVAFAARFIVNGTNQVIEVAGAPMATATAQSVVKKLEQLRADRGTPEDAQNKQAEEMKTRIANLQSLSHLPVHELV